jgi:putative transposase
LEQNSYRSNDIDALDDQRDEHHIHLIVYHLICCPKRQRKALVNQIGTRCDDLIRQKCDEKGWTNLELAVQPDHVHLFVRVWPSVSAADVVKECKGFFAFTLRKEFPELPRLPSLWTRSYFASTAGSVSGETILRSIEAQSRQQVSPVRDEGLRKSYKYKLKPTPEQARQLEEVVWPCRMLYNTALEERITAYRRCGVTLTCYQQQAELPELKAAFPEYATIHSQVLQDVLTRLDKTYQAFFRRVKAGQTPGFPRFHGRNRYHSFTYKQYGNGARLDTGFLALSRVGRVAVRWSRPLEGTLKTVTIAREADGWYAIISCADVPAQPLPATRRETGIDVGLKVFLITADGLVVDNPHHYRRGEKKLAKAGKRVSRRKKGSKRRGKAVGQLARAHQTVKRQRADFHHKTALALLRQYDTIYLEDLRVANMVRNRHLAKNISDAGWAAFRAILDAKAICAGRRVIAVPPANTSQDCSGCGTRVSKSLSVRTHVCPSCGLVLDRDENAARNIQAAGIHWAGQALRGLAGYPAGMNRASVELEPVRSVKVSPHHSSPRQRLCIYVYICYTHARPARTAARQAITPVCPCAMMLLTCS